MYKKIFPIFLLLAGGFSSLQSCARDTEFVGALESLIGPGKHAWSGMHYNPLNKEVQRAKALKKLKSQPKARMVGGRRVSTGRRRSSSSSSADSTTLVVPLVAALSGFEEVSSPDSGKVFLPQPRNRDKRVERGYKHTGRDKTAGTIARKDTNPRQR